MTPCRLTWVMLSSVVGTTPACKVSFRSGGIVVRIIPGRVPQYQERSVCLVFYYPPDPIRGGPPRATDPPSLFFLQRL